MCGITGFIDKSNRLNLELLKKMTDSLTHRGPDDSGYFTDFIEGSTRGLGQRRLSILDLSLHGHQPRIFDNICIAYNGEVYNFQELKKYLITKGYDFNSESDTEVILKLYHLEGIDFLNKLNGMFSLSIFDKRNNNFYNTSNKFFFAVKYYLDWQIIFGRFIF